MKTLYNILSIFVFCVILVKVWAAPKLIVVLVDGVRWDYMEDPKLKGFRKIADTGVKAPYVVPIFPSLSYPNYYSIVTGLYAENHGFVDNYLYDNDTDSLYRMSPDPHASDPIWWNEAEPVWITAEKNNLPTAMYWWDGCETRIRGRHSTICERIRYGPPTPEEREDFLERIDDMVELFKPTKTFPSGRLSLALMYYGSTDYSSHHDGPDSKGVREALYDIDGILDTMLKKLEKAGLKDQVNIMVLSDHGLTDVSKVKGVDLDRFSPLIRYQVSAGTHSMIIPNDGKLEELYREIKQANIDGIEVYKKEDIPEKYHIKKGKRTTPLFILAKKGYMIKKLEDRSKSIGGSQIIYHGAHGYDPIEVEDMRSMFVATGPDFKENYKTQPLNITDLYNVMCNILHLNPLPNNGSWEKAKSMLKENRDSTAPSKIVK